MRRHLLDLIVLFVFVTIVCVYIVLAQPSIRDTTVHVYVFVVGGLLMLAIVAAAGDALPHRRLSDFDRALAQGAAKEKPLPELEKMNREVTLATASAYDLHYRLRPRVRAIVASRLADRRGIDLERPGTTLNRSGNPIAPPSRHHPTMKYADTPITAVNDSAVNNHRRQVMRRRASETGRVPFCAS